VVVTERPLGFPDDGIGHDRFTVDQVSAAVATESVAEFISRF
jgi:hypothetical protein